MWHVIPPWSWSWLWYRTSGFTKAIVVLLAAMFLHAVLVFIDRLVAFNSAKKHVPVFESPAEAQAIRNAGVFAFLIASAVEAFQSSPSCSHAEVIEFALKSMQRSAALIRARMKNGFSTVATIAAVAPFVGLSGTTIGVLDAFRGGSDTPTGWMIYYGNALGLSLVPTAIGIGVGIVAVWFYNVLVRKLEMFDIDSTAASANVAAYLHAQPRFPSGEGIAALNIPQFASRGARDWEAPYDPHGVLLGVWLVWLYVIATITWTCVWDIAFGYN
ncbi:MAG: MotA/TolQ/ExbB proton channel family protein [Terriglobales bacterium]